MTTGPRREVRYNRKTLLLKSTHRINTHDPIIFQNYSVYILRQPQGRIVQSGEQEGMLLREIAERNPLEENIGSYFIF